MSLGGSSTSSVMGYTSKLAMAASLVTVMTVSPIRANPESASSLRREARISSTSAPRWGSQGNSSVRVVPRPTEAIEGELMATLDDIDDLRTWETGWNGYDADPPLPAAVDYAETWVKALYNDVITMGAEWATPNVTAGAFGEVVLEWWSGSRKLTVYLEDGAAEYVKVWGPNITSEMSEGNAKPARARRTLWRWLMQS